MKLGFVSDSLGGLPFETMLDHAARAVAYDLPLPLRDLLDFKNNAAVCHVTIILGVRDNFSP